MLTCDEEKHEYRYDGVKVPGVNRILSASGIVNFNHIPIEKREAGMHFGKVIHSACQFYDEGDLDINKVIESDKYTEYKVMPYLNSWINFRKDSNAKIISIEKKLYSKKYNFAGRHDRVFNINNPTMLDIKTGIDSKGSTDLQLAGYSILWDENYPLKKIKYRIAVHLTPFARCKYQIIPYKNKSDKFDFLVCLQMYNLKKKRGLL